MAQLLKDQKFQEYCKILKVSGQTPSDPDRRCIEKAFRRAALKTHPDKVCVSALPYRIVESYNEILFSVLFYK